ncbi:MAG: MBL fold metallo-hydrolase [Burkholderiaceae bacterium]|nr:MBL fold metallo-hydrolase [Burkholderiaceae bacterium]
MEIDKKNSIKKLGAAKLTACFSPFSTCFADDAESAAALPSAALSQTHQNPSGFVVHKLSDSLYAIGEPDYYQHNYSYLLVGQARALMFDAGANQNDNIAEVVSRITALPVAVLPSHLHFDHIGGLHNFQTIYLADLAFFESFKRRDERYHIPESVHLGNFDGLAFAPFKADRLLAPGESIDLGGLSVKVIYTPGHSPDQISLYDETNNVFLSADHLYPSRMLAGNIAQYVQSMSNTLDLIDRDTRIYAAHAHTRAAPVPAVTHAQALAIYEVMKGIFDGTLEGQPYRDETLVKSASKFDVEGDISILSDIVFLNGRPYSYS